MDRDQLKNYKPLKRELKMLDKVLEKLYNRRGDIPTVMGKVMSSSKDFPYIETHITVEMEAPKEADELGRKIREKEERKEEVRREIRAVEEFIEGMPEGEYKRIFELCFLEGMKQDEIADIMNYSRARISQKVNEYLQH
ncbi:sigma-70 family RNA polymerase sigma factor [Lacrimispora sp. NSJ-141]|uniref:Sigma-70 family RNA polymerase sigma factor n=1 Tax=Lientehia hominis TaxID=2897778 RepID=A0AAP2W8Y7_9FIRM|nr:sigma factor-like helix-turn-helix DNA-binding protein [Lientehia hominis]MCD2492745.1 sigma-70 family RNA polymerase sigma factor [Lientehia hominis]